ncbi:HAD family phosphatase [Subsaximicrobium wynnwilliamsii]|jgi:putative hydrolase of the HAD superfamily|uniref:HAD family phosphatase n=1 Tax=Subsaximicrobium wynnwilliamsii TaxID=291179 RepID=A0A5C6ZMB6_9FLAO|nr:HAD family phosphatase [Subsaximicrobium wynnwilliamsii]TXD85173.1 HAD family phosphatase [Subsaximicrobium wynnwilliamsii]TXD91216.1 HAD family phosphatase [Subsaximicrobium wynnwilliamsii]TXE04609.1 HAD family phosphatase [Subsaximicrobium wynnwilliamsii]
MPTIKTIIFDFGAVFIDLNKEVAHQNALALFELDELHDELVSMNTLYEQGLMSTEEFLDFYTANFPKLSKPQLIDTWNSMLGHFPEKRLNFIKSLASEANYKLILLSNTNDLHINWIIDNVPFFEDFKKQFDAFYLSHEIQLRKPNADIYEFVLKQNKLTPEECLFIDDTKANTDAAANLGIHIWNIDETQEDVTDLFRIKKDLF